MLLGNFYFLNRLPLKVVSNVVDPGILIIGLDSNRYNPTITSLQRLMTFRDASSSIDYLYDQPIGQYPPNSYLLPIDAGNISSRYELTGSTSYNINGTLGFNIATALQGTGTIDALIGALSPIFAQLQGSGFITANGQSIGVLLSSLVGSGNITNAQLLALLNAVATLVGSGDITLADATLTSAISIAAQLYGTGAITQADVSLLINMIGSVLGSSSFLASIYGQGNLNATTPGQSTLTPNLSPALNFNATLTGASLLQGLINALAFINSDVQGSGKVNSSSVATALGELQSIIRSYGDMTPQGIADAVWSALLASYSTMGTTGFALLGLEQNATPEKFAEAVWNSILKNYQQNGSAGQIVEQVKQLTIANS